MQLKEQEQTTMIKVDVTGGYGFVGQYIVQALLDKGYFVNCYDNLSKYGEITRSFHNHPNFRLHKIDLSTHTPEFEGEYVIHLAAKIGGIRYFNKRAAEIISVNSKIDNRVLDAVVKNSNIKKFIAFSSSMVFENAYVFPTPEHHINYCPIPKTDYGFSKLNTERQTQSICRSHNIPYIIIRPFNACGLEDGFDNQDSHVLPELAYKILKGQFPLEILGNGNQVRHYTHGKDIAKATLLLMNSNIQNEDFNISSDRPTTVIELAEMIWGYINPNIEFKYTLTEPYPGDVMRRSPCVEKAEKAGFTAQISLEQTIKEVVDWIKLRMNE